MVAVNPKRAVSFGDDPEQYDRARPAYAAATIDALVADRPLRVLDIGCGTGTASRQFAKRGCVVHGVEHDARMAAVARATGMHVDVCTLEDWPPPLAHFDLAVAAQSWHWMDPAIAPAKVAQALSATGSLAILWLSYSHQANVEAAFANVYGELAPELLESSFPVGCQPRGLHSGLQAKYADQLRHSGAFQPANFRVDSEQREYSADEWLDELPTHSDHRTLPDEERSMLLEALTRALQGLGGHLTVELTTYAVMATVEPGWVPAPRGAQRM